jgi:hypothetical protein
MPDLKISQLNNGDPAQSNDQVPVNRAGVNFSITAGSIAALSPPTTPAGSDTQVQFNDGGAFGGDAGLTYNKTTAALSASTLNALAATANTSSIAATGYSLTGSSAVAMVDLAGTWNTTGTPTAIKLNLTDAASTSSSLFMDMQIAGVSRFNVNKSGAIAGATLTTSETAVNSSAIASTGFSLTGSSGVSMIDLAGTWNTTGTPTLIKANVTDTASNAASLLMDLQVGGTSQFSVAKGGSVTVADAANFVVGTSTGTKIGTTTSQKISFWNATPIVQPVNTVAIDTLLVDTGLRASGGTATFATDISRVGANAQSTAIKQLTELTTIAAAADTDTTIQIPAGAILLGVTARVTVTITGTTTFDLGITGDTDKFGAAVSSTAATTRVGSITPELNASAISVKITPNTTPSDNAGRVRITIHYIELAASTS